jgi:hypothetical protein
MSFPVSLPKAFGPVIATPQIEEVKQREKEADSG